MIIEVEKNILLRDYLQELPISKAMVKRIKNKGDFLVNGKSQTVRYFLQKGDQLEIIFPQEESSIQPENIPLKIIYEDAYYLIIDKECRAYLLKDIKVILYAMHLCIITNKKEFKAKSILSTV